ncbi:zinc ribbon domain-containing protein [Methanobrevibacter sp.]|uniref:zinc ribbon domain-containing protein n=1 Tax=Methanobrevibacter sp. TaxID=66852 RepID=UPI0025EB2647|nr:zinc ribbon domain-containing protein [Methanobrevibacter sp.]MBQ2961352.1 zinc ribbon domain-containing protein [Methanobrevibacter sp.]
MAKYCGNCGRELSDEAKFCPNCGQEYVPRYKADHYSDGSSKREFDGPFDDFDNRSSRNPFESSSKKDSSSGSDKSESFPWGKVCIVLFIVLLLFSAISYYGSQGDNSNGYDTSIIEDSSDNLSYDPSNTKYLYDRNRDERRGDIGTNEPYKIAIDSNAYLSGKGEAQLIDSNHSYNLESEDFTITEYETYYVNVDDDDWYVLEIFKCKFDTPSQRQVYSTDMDNGDPIIIYGGKGEYYGYGIIIPNSSDDSTYKDISFLESIFYYMKE